MFLFLFFHEGQKKWGKKLQFQRVQTMCALTKTKEVKKLKLPAFAFQQLMHDVFVGPLKKSTRGWVLQKEKNKS